MQLPRPTVLTVESAAEAIVCERLVTANVMPTTGPSMGMAKGQVMTGSTSAALLKDPLKGIIQELSRLHLNREWLAIG
jgi:hypothetical protein